MTTERLAWRVDIGSIETTRETNKGSILKEEICTSSSSSSVARAAAYKPAAYKQRFGTYRVDYTLYMLTIRNVLKCNHLLYFRCSSKYIEHKMCTNFCSFCRRLKSTLSSQIKSPYCTRRPILSC